MKTFIEDVLSLAWDGALVGAIAVTLFMGADLLAMILTSWGGLGTGLLLALGLALGFVVAVGWALAHRMSGNPSARGPK
jgi:hypothetical protein